MSEATATQELNNVGLGMKMETDTTVVSATDVNTAMEVGQDPPAVVNPAPDIIHTKEGKVTLEHGASPKIFYNPIQEVNRDISILGIQTFIEQEKKEKVTILEAMAASGIRSIRYAKEIQNILSVIANDYSAEAIDSIKRNSKLNEVVNTVVPSYFDASALMHSQHGRHFVVDIDPYGTPIPFLDAAVQCVADGGLLIVTATDLAVMAGNTPETCYAKYGSMSLRSGACHEMALRIMIHAVQSFANRYGRCAEPLLSLKIDFYVRLFFKITKNPKKCKETVINTSMVFQCTGCRSLSLQPLCVKKMNAAATNSHYHIAQGPTVPQKCEFCQQTQHIGGPIWSGPIHNKAFVAEMMKNLRNSYTYLNTAPRIEGFLTVVLEEVDTPLFYLASQLCSVLRCPAIPMLKLRSAFLNRGYEVSSSHTDRDTIKTNASNKVIWQIICAWHDTTQGGKLKEGTPGHIIMANNVTLAVDFSLHPNANPVSRSKGMLRYQMNPTPNWGPGVRGAFDANNQEFHKKKVNQNRKKRRRLNDNSPNQAKIE